MKKLALVVALTSVVAAGSVYAQGFGRAVVKPGESGNAPSSRVTEKQYRREAPIRSSDYDRTPGGSDAHLNFAPIALSVGPWGMPYGRFWAITGLHFNLGVPNCSFPYHSVYGVDVGLSGESYSEAGGLLVNAINNRAPCMYGLAVAGLWNQSTGGNSVAVQVAAGCNFADRLDGAQISLYNRAHELHGVQIGLYNLAVGGTGLQIGLWNDQGNGTGTPIIGIVY